MRFPSDSEIQAARQTVSDVINARNLQKLRSPLL